MHPIRRPKVCFVFIAQRHQILHGVSIAAALARSGRIDVHVAATTSDHLDYIRELVSRLGGAALTYHRLWPDGPLFRGGRSVAPKAAALALNLKLFRRFDVIVTPERTSLLLKRLGLRRQIFIHTDHGAGDRAVGYEPRIALFDMVLLAGEKQRRRMQAAGLLREDGYAIVGYPKFDVVDAIRAEPPALFADDRPVVLYNPHFHPELGSWRRFGLGVLEQFAASADYNLIFAPHIRLFDGAPPRMREAAERFADCGNIHVDLGGERSVDMTYTNVADVYLGDVSSQVYEFLRRPRPCLFLNAPGAPWEDDENYAHWRTGPVVDQVHDLGRAVDQARLNHAAFAPAQRSAFARTFDLLGSSSERAASAILDCLARRLSHSQFTREEAGPDYAPAGAPVFSNQP
jgi:hypothetical protein